MKIENQNMQSPRLSKIRNFLFAGLAVVWFSEMLFLGFPFLSKIWTSQWLVTPPRDSELLSAFYINWAISSPVKGAFFIMAILGLTSKNISTRKALFISMALVPPLNIAFPFRQQGFLLKPMLIASVLSSILWISFFLFPEKIQKSSDKEYANQKSKSLQGWEIFQYTWFGFFSTTLTGLAILFLFWPVTALQLTYPCIASLSNASTEELSGLMHNGMAAGTHMLALAIGSWICTINCKSNPTLRNAMTIAGITYCLLLIVFPFRLIYLQFGSACALSSLMILFAPLLVGWLIYSYFSFKVERKPNLAI